MLEISELTIKEIQSHYKNGNLTCETLIVQYLDRIDRFDKGKSGLNSIIEINPHIIDIAREKDIERINGKKIGLLHGIPVLIKDNINTTDGMHTRAGSLALANNLAPYDAFVVKKLKEAGAIILGKSNLTEFANIMTKGMPGGYSSMGGQTWCPYKKRQSPSGSSSGSAVAVSANLCSVSIGTETTGSIISPAHRNGVVGIKPTAGLVSRSGIIPVSKTLDIAGPMARTVEDAAILLSVIYGQDTEDKTTLAIPKEFSMEFIDELSLFSLKGIRIGINRNHKSQSREEQVINNKLFNLLKYAGAELIEGIEINASKCASSIIVHEMKECMNEYFSTLADDFEIKSLDDVIAFNDRYRNVHRYGQIYLELANEKFPEGTKSAEYIEMMKKREVEIEEFDKVFANNDLDVIFFETMTDLPPVTGFPSMTVPIGEYKGGLSLGSNWIAKRFEEEKLIKIAYVVEKLTNARICPDLKQFEKLQS